MFYHLVDLIGMVYEVFPQMKDEVLLEKQRPRRRLKKNLQDEPRVLLLCAPAPCRKSGRLLPPLEMISGSSKEPPWSAKWFLHSYNLSQIRMAMIPLQ